MLLFATVNGVGDGDTRPILALVTGVECRVTPLQTIAPLVRNVSEIYLASAVCQAEIPLFP